MFSRVKSDVLSQKKEKLMGFMAQFQNSVSLITAAIDSLSEANKNIADTIAEIDDYQHQLDETKTGLTDTKVKNERVIANFKALVCIEEE